MLSAVGQRSLRAATVRRIDELRCAPVALMIAVALVLAPDDASAATLRSSAASLGALAVFAGLLFVREWPTGLAGSVWAAGTVFAAALWFWRTRYRPEWLALPSGFRARVGKSQRQFAQRVSPVVSAACACNVDAVLEAARSCFVNLQAAWDAGDIEELRAHTTAEMLHELLQELPMRGPGPNQTDVVTLDAALLGLEQIGNRYVASVEFSGMIRESIEEGAAPFKEVWMLTCEVDAMPDWRLARQQALL